MKPWMSIIMPTTRKDRCDWMGKRIRGIITDLDGTLLEEDKTISREMEQIVKRLEAEQILFTFITGRPKYATERFAKQLQLQTPVVSCNGAILFHGDRTISRHSFKIGALKPLLELAGQKGLTVLYYSGDVEYAMDYTEWVRKRRLSGRIYPVRRMMPEDWEGLQVEKINIMADDKADAFARLIPEIERIKDDFSVALYGCEGCEIVAAGVNKHLGMMELAEYMQIPVEEIMAIGDNNNDIEMLKQAGFGVAVGNASQAAKDAADYVCTGERTVGVVEAIRRFVLKDE